VVIVIKGRFAGYRVYLPYPAAEGIVGEFRYIAAVLGDFDDAVLVVIFVFVAVPVPR